MTDRRLVRVTLTFDDGSKSEVVGAEECEKWRRVADSQAALAFTHGCQYDPPLWKLTSAPQDDSGDA